MRGLPIVSPPREVGVMALGFQGRLGGRGLKRNQTSVNSFSLGSSHWCRQNSASHLLLP